MSEFQEGRYDQLITKRLRELFDRQAPTGLKSLVAALEENDCPDCLARHLIGQIKSLLRGVSADDRKRRQITLANSLLDFMRSQEEELIEPDPIDPSGEILRALYRGADQLRSPFRDDPELPEPGAIGVPRSCVLGLCRTRRSTPGFSAGS